MKINHVYIILYQFSPWGPPGPFYINLAPGPPGPLRPIGPLRPMGPKRPWALGSMGPHPGLHGAPTLGPHESQWVPMGPHGSPWVPMGPHGVPMGAHVLLLYF